MNHLRKTALKDEVYITKWKDKFNFKVGKTHIVQKPIISVLINTFN